MADGIDAVAGRHRNVTHLRTQVKPRGHGRPLVAKRDPSLGDSHLHLLRRRLIGNWSPVDRVVVDISCHQPPQIVAILHRAKERHAQYHGNHELNGGPKSGANWFGGRGLGPDFRWGRSDELTTLLHRLPELDDGRQDSLS